MRLVKKLYPVLFLLLTACLYKSIDTGSTDDIFYTYPDRIGDKPVLVNFEAVFQASNKGSENGVYYVSGHNDFRVSVYDLDSGTLLRRVKVGKTHIPLVGITPDSLWFYQPRRGLFALDRVRFEVNHTQRDILEANTELTLAPAYPKAYLIRDYYGVDPATGKLVFTDNAAYRYTLDDTTLKLSPFEGEFAPEPNEITIRLEDRLGDYPETVSLEGDLRREIVKNDTVILKGESFIEGRFMPADRTDLLFIAHKETVDPDAGLLVSAVEVSQEGVARLLWTTKIPGVVFDIIHTQTQSTLLSTFSKGDPEYDYMYFRTFENRFCFIYSLHAGCIDLETGKLLWLKRL